MVIVVVPNSWSRQPLPSMAFLWLINGVTKYLRTGMIPQVPICNWAFEHRFSGCDIALCQTIRSDEGICLVVTTENRTSMGYNSWFMLVVYRNGPRKTAGYVDLYVPRHTHLHKIGCDV